MWIFLLLCGLSSHCGSKDYSLVAMCGLLIAVASLVVEHGLCLGLPQLWLLGFRAQA